MLFRTAIDSVERRDGVIFGVGTDIIETARIARVVARGRQYLETIFTENEIAYCEGKAHKSQHYAARYAAKEAALKALGVGQARGLAFRDIEVLNDENGQPQLFFHGRTSQMLERLQVKHAVLSLSHTRESAVAVIILEK